MITRENIQNMVNEIYQDMANEGVPSLSIKEARRLDEIVIGTVEDVVRVHPEEVNEENLKDVVGYTMYATTSLAAVGLL